MKIFKLYHTLRIYIPFIIVNIMLLSIASTYALNYLYFFFAKKHFFVNQEQIKVFLIVSYYPSGYSALGIFLSGTLLFCLMMSLICLYLTLLSDPGYLDTPMKSEGLLFSHSNESLGVSRHKPQSIQERNFRNNFCQIASNGPLNGNEFLFIKNCINTLFKEQSKSKVSSEGISLCSQCIRWKPERSHHCKRCDKCVRKMDHHCPWVANCIGENNRKSFSLAIMYGIIPSGFILFTLWEYLIMINMDSSTSNMLCIWNTLIYVCNCVFFLFLAYLLFTNTRLIAYNMTTIEREELLRFEMVNRYIGKPPLKNKYDQGILNNMSEVFGRNPFLWFVPINPKRKNEYEIFLV